jgi:nitrite reductase (NADH) small subunit
VLQDVGSVEELTEGQPEVVRVGGREIAIVLWRGEVYAVRNVCPHQTQPLGTGLIRSRLRGDPGRPGLPEIDDEDPVIVCPVHTWEFSLTSGACVTHGKLRVRSYPVRLEDGRVLVELGR